MDEKQDSAKNDSVDIDDLLNKLEVEDTTTDSEVVDDDFIDEVSLKDAEVHLSEEELDERHQKSLTFKQEGNDLFKETNYAEARRKYTEALRICPLRCSKDRAVLFANRGACSMKESRKTEAIEDCTNALELDPTYLKAVKRRAQLYKESDKLDECLEDYKKVFELDRTDKEAIEAIQSLPSQINERNEKLKEQMMGTLKDLGNKILRPFGLSTENFQLQQDPNSGGYTINFNQNKS